MRRFLITFTIFIICFSLTLKWAPLASATNQVNLYFFYSQACPHCALERQFLEHLKQELDFLNVHTFDATQNVSLLIKANQILGINLNYVPITIIGDQSITGYYNDETTGQEIKNLVQTCRQTTCPDSLANLITASPTPAPSLPPTPLADSFKLTVPILGIIDARDYSLPILTITIAAIDGFNPCAMWVLLFLISLLLGMKNRRKMWLLGTVFIAASACVYFLFLAAWLNLLLFLGFIVWVRIIIGLVAIGSGTYHLKEFFTNKEAACKVTSPEKRQRVFQKLKEITQSRSFLIALLGIILLAFAVNLVELICSAGLPAIYTQVLTLASLPMWQYYLYLLLYTLIFMLDDLFVFFVAMKTLHLTGITTKYSRYSNLIGGIIIAIIGILLIFKPEWIMLK